MSVLDQRGNKLHTELMKTTEQMKTPACRQRKSPRWLSAKGHNQLAAWLVGHEAMDLALSLSTHLGLRQKQKPVCVRVCVRERVHAILNT